MAVLLDFLPIFIDEAQETLEQWESLLQELNGADVTEPLNALFRCAHNLKGSSKSLGLAAFGDFIHEVEEVINALRNNKISLGDDVLEALTISHLHLKIWVDELPRQPEFAPDLGDFIILLKKLVGVQTEAAAQAGDIIWVDFSAPAAPLPEVQETQGNADHTIDKSSVTSSKSDASNHVVQAKKQDETVRVSRSRLDSLLRQVSELQTQYAIFGERLTVAAPQWATDEAFELSRKILREIQDNSFSLVMDPIQPLFERLQTVVQEVSQKVGKQVVVHFYGGETPLDKKILEKIKDPLVHILRNAIDHGIEAPDERTKKGKSATGEVKIEASLTIHGVWITVTDDGGGMDPQKLLAKAKQKGLLPAHAQPSDDECFKIIFLPGFSTAAKVTDVSGRGVGMDVVKRTVEELGGELQLSSQLGKGSVFRIYLPSNINIVDSLIVKLKGLPFAVPLREIEEIVDLNEYRIDDRKGFGAWIQFRGQVTPVVKLTERLKGLSAAGFVTLSDQAHAQSGDSSLQAGTLGKARRKGLLLPRTALLHRKNNGFVAFEVDAVESERAVVARRLSQKLGNIPGVAGSTILGSGEPGIILSLEQFELQAG